MYQASIIFMETLGLWKQTKKKQTEKTGDLRKPTLQNQAKNVPSSQVVCDELPAASDS